MLKKGFCCCFVLWAHCVTSSRNVFLSHYFSLDYDVCLWFAFRSGVDRKDTWAGAGLRCLCLFALRVRCIYTESVMWKEEGETEWIDFNQNMSRHCLWAFSLYILLCWNSPLYYMSRNVASRPDASLYNILLFMLVHFVQTFAKNLKNVHLFEGLYQ